MEKVFKIKRDLNGIELSVLEAIEIDGGTRSIANNLLEAINEAKENNWYGGEMVSNYNTYKFTFADNLIKIHGITSDECVNVYNLNDFISDLEVIAKA